MKTIFLITKKLHRRLRSFVALMIVYYQENLVKIAHVAERNYLKIKKE